MKSTTRILLFLVMMGMAPVMMGMVPLGSPTGIHYTKGDREKFDAYIRYIQPYKNDSLGLLMEKTATFFLGSPYVSHTLEVTETEQLVINLREFDCVTYIETVIALSQTIKAGKENFEAFADQMRQLRYRGGNIEGYASRLHYTSEWVYDNQQAGWLKNISQSLNGLQERKQIDFMSTHRDAYRQLASNDSLWQEIMSVEQAINDRDGFYYIPKEKINAVASRIPHMSLVGFTTRINGLDTTHTGFAFHEEGRLTFIHASSLKEEVVIDTQTLHDYCAGQSSCTGIIVALVL